MISWQAVGQPEVPKPPAMETQPVEANQPSEMSPLPPVLLPSATAQSLLSRRWRAFPERMGEKEALGLALRVDCFHDANKAKGSNQSCLQVTGLRFEMSHRRSDTLWATLSLDPFGSPSAQFSRHPGVIDPPSSSVSALQLVDDFAVVWTPRLGLQVALELYDGAGWVPTVSGLASSGIFVERAWKQLAVSVAYALPVLGGMRAKFTGGNGEGEPIRNLDPQQYLGFEVEGRVYEGVVANLGLSFDENSAGSESWQWMNESFSLNCKVATPANVSKGFSTQRLALGVALDGSLPAARGLQAALAWQRVTQKDLDSQTRSIPAISELDDCLNLHPDRVVYESTDVETANTIQRSSVTMSLSYKLLGDIFVGGEYGIRNVDFGDVRPVTKCEAFRGSLCVERDDSKNHLTQTAWMVGGGILLGDGLKLTLEYVNISYDALYAQFNYPEGSGSPDRQREYFNARLAYLWDS